MFHCTKIQFISLFLASISIGINAAETMIEENPADMYLGTCYALQYLKLHYCPTTNTTKMATCITSIVDEVDEKNKDEVKLNFKTRAKLIMPHVIKHIDESFPKYLAKVKGDRNKTCLYHQQNMQNSMKKYLETFRSNQVDFAHTK
ncbi:MAG: hypothetical protein FJY41_05880 [Betaproteobacteria bacterium]|nr:hypothetical protein [Betaproteobacteria bacterium]